MNHYNQTTPPKFDLAQINKPVHLFVGGKDELADPFDAEFTKNSLINAQNLTYNLYDNYGHASFLIGKNVSYIEDVIKVIEESNYY